MTKKELIDYCLTFTAAYEDYPFDGNWAAMRHSGNSKAFAFIYEHDSKLCVNLKCEPMRAEFLRKVYSAVIPAYHMNKLHWNTVVIDDTIPNEEIFDMINHSYALIAPNIKQRARKS